MSFIKKQSIGFYLTILAVIFGLVGITAYFINCNTAYFSNQGVHMGLVVCIIVGIIFEIIYILGSEKDSTKIWLDAFPVLSGILLMVGFVIFVSLRVNSIATILSFERNAQTMSDLSSEIVGMVCCLLGVLFTIISSFFRIEKEK